jgi:zinc protease
VKQLHALAVLVVIFTGSIVVGEQAPDWKAPLPVDPLVQRGRMPNGLTYWIRKHATPPEKVGAWIHVGTGSLNEDENQRGLAHLLEHMAFNGSANFPPGTLTQYFESIGLSFGRDQNAFTSFDQTTYMIYLPDPKPETVGKGLLCLADYAFRQLLTKEEVEKERMVVLEEVRARKGKDQRLLDKMLPLLIPGSRVAERLPIGKEEVVRGANRELIQAYYRRWYRPEFSTVLLVGDIEPSLAEKLVGEAFKDWKAEGPTPVHADPGVQPYTTTRAATITDPELAEAQWTIVNVKPLRQEKTLGDFRERLIEQLGCWILNRRLSDLLQKGRAPYQSAYCSVSTWFNACTTVSAGAGGTPAQWNPMLVALLTELKRARTHGFNPQELDDAKRAVIAGSEQSVRTEPTRDMRGWLERLNGVVAKKQLPMSEAQRAQCLLQTMPWVTLNDVNEAFRKNFAPENRLLLLELPESKDRPAPAEADILAVAREAEEAQVDALAQKERPASLLDADPGRALVEHDDWNEELEVYSAWFQNNVRVHVREMSFKKSQAWVQITLPGGRLHETAGTRCLADAAALAFNRHATAKFDSVQLRDFLVGRNVAVSGWGEDDALGLQISGSPEDLELGLQLAHLLLREARIEAPALEKWREQAKDDWKDRQRNVEAQLSERLSILKGGGDPRFLGWSPEMLDRVTLESAQAFLDRHLKDAPMEVAIVGDLSRFRAMELARKYLGTLPRRPRLDGKLDALRKLKLPRGPIEETVHVDTITDRALVALGWRGPDWRDVKERRQMFLASQILQSRLREEVREKRGLTYSVYASARAAEAYPGTGFVGAYAIADPKKIDDTVKATRDVFDAFLAGGPTEEEMATVRKQIENQLEVQLREPSYWLSLLSDLDYRGTRLSDVAVLRERMQGYTREEIHKTLRKYIKPEGYLQVLATPKPGATAEEEKTSQAKQ